MKKLFFATILFFSAFLVANATSFSASRMTVCSRDQNGCDVKQTTYVNISSAGTYNVTGNVGRGTHSTECQAHEDFDLYIDGNYYASSIDPDPCEAGLDNIYKDYGFPSITLSAGSHKITMVHRWMSKPSTGHLESVSVALTFSTPQAPAKPTCSVSANKNSINQGESAVITWSSKNTKSASFDNGIGSVNTSGSLSVSPQSSTQYTGVFSGSGGTVKCNVNINVVPSSNPQTPSCSMSLSKDTITKGESVNLVWSSSNVSGAVIDQGIGSVATVGSLVVTPESNTTYTGVFSGSDGNTTCNVLIVVNEQPSGDQPACSLGLSPTSIRKGNSAVLYWNSANVSTTTIDQGIGLVDNSGSVSVSPTSNTTYTGVFEGPNGSRICSATLSITTGGGGGLDQPTVSLSSTTQEPESSFIYLSQIPYTGIPESVLVFFRIFIFGTLFGTYYYVHRRFA